MRKVREFESDKDYIAAQDRDSTWSTQSEFGDAAAIKFVEFGQALLSQGLMFHDDKVADFGGNDGYAAHRFFVTLGIRPTVVDCEPKRLSHAREIYGLPTVQAFLEDLSAMPDKSVDWGFCSHTLEHTRDTGKALREMARVVKRGALFVMPLENDKWADDNHAHAVNCPTVYGWSRVLMENGWAVRRTSKPIPYECLIAARPKR